MADGEVPLVEPDQRNPPARKVVIRWLLFVVVVSGGLLTLVWAVTNCQGPGCEGVGFLGLLILGLVGLLVALFESNPWKPPRRVTPASVPPGNASIRPFAEVSNASTAFILGLVGLMMFGLPSPFAWIIAHKELRAIEVGRRSPEYRRKASVARVLGIIGTLILLLFVAALVLGISTGSISW